jgi:prephenate dehydratase
MSILNGTRLRIAIQGELGSNSHMAALQLLEVHGREVEIVPCTVSAEVFERLVGGEVDAAVLPIENSLHGSVAEHYDLLLQNPVRIVGEGLLRIRFHLIAMPGVTFGELRRVLSHPVALAQCRRFLAAHRELEAVPFYDTAGSVKHLMEQGLRETAGIAPELAATQYGGEILERDLEDHAENFTRFQVICREDKLLEANAVANKMTIAFSVEHRPGSLVEALQLLSAAGVDLTRIESRPVPGKPWEYVFYVEFRFGETAQADAVLEKLRGRCRMVKELGRYPEV